MARYKFRATDQFNLSSASPFIENKSPSSLFRNKAPGCQVDSPAHMTHIRQSFSSTYKYAMFCVLGGVCLPAYLNGRGSEGVVNIRGNLHLN